MKTVAVFLQFIFLPLAAAAQASWVYPLEAGNVSVFRYSESGGGRTSVLAITTTTSASNINGAPDTVMLQQQSGGVFPVPAWSDDWYPVRSLDATIDSSGMLWTRGGRHDWRQEFPTRPPSADTLRIVHGAGDTVLAVVSMRGPMLILDTVPVQAFACTILEPGRQRTVVIADGFGLVEAVDSMGSMTLVNAHIGGVDWNPERRAFDYMPMCRGDVRHVSYSFIDEHEPWNSVHRNFGDTLATELRVTDTTYLVSSRSGIAYRSDASGVFCRSQGGGEYCVIPSHATLGTIVGSMIVTDTAVVSAFGRMRRRLLLEWSDLDWAASEVWTEGLGRTYWSTWSYFTGEESETLMYYRICGEEYGTPLDAPPL
jgi:hypothetical protein